jgi:hypothetical protein
MLAIDCQRAQSNRGGSSLQSDPSLLDPSAAEGVLVFAPELLQAIQRELEAICDNSEFRSSKRNCSFLRHVVTETLAGRGNEIKERTLGVELFGRPATYDTGSDAVVRVRANEVRKRLACYYEENRSQSGWRIQLPLRSYVPRFSPERDAAAAAPATEKSMLVAPPVAPRSPLTLSHMMMPTLVALFLCAATFRWQIFSGTPYLDFWEMLLAGHSSVDLVLDPDSADPHAVPTEDLSTVGPLLQAAAILHIPAQVVSSSDLKGDRTSAVPIFITHRTQPGQVGGANDSEGATYITVVPGKQPKLWISGGWPGTIALAIHSISSEEAFPQVLEMALRRNQPTSIRIAPGEKVTMQNARVGGAQWAQ